MAQAPCPPLSVTTYAIYLPCQLTTLPVITNDDRVLQYPDMLRQARMVGQATVSAVIDSLGATSRQHLRVDTTSNLIWELAALESADALTFFPGQRDGRPVHTQVELEFVWTWPQWPERVGPVLHPDRVAEWREATPTGFRITVGVVPRQPSMAPPAESTLARVRLAAAVAALDVIERAPGQVACIVYEGRTDPDVAGLTALQSTFHQVEPHSRCPHTYLGMFGLVDPEGRRIAKRPDGVIDPVQVLVGRVEPWTPDLMMVEVGREESMFGRWLVCEVERNKMGAWFGRCWWSGGFWAY